MEKEFRVIGVMKKWRNNMDEVEEELTQYLQEKVVRKYTWFGLLPNYRWVTIDSEHVPSFAWIHKCVFGDETDWKSKFCNINNCTFIKK